ncbi:MAG: DUF349 domain-containing protein [Balneolales bacterium]
MPESVLNQKSKDSVHLFENESGYITGDGRIFQKDNTYFRGKEIGIVKTSKPEESFDYYQQAFTQLEAYAEKTLTAIASTSEQQVQLENLNNLALEIGQSNAIGDFNVLLEKIDAFKKKISGREDVELTSIDQPNEANEESSLPEYEEIAKKAEELSTESDWQYISLEFDNLKLKWEKLPVPDDKKTYNDLWARIKEAEQKYYLRKKEHQKAQKERKQSNLEKRQQLLDRLSKIVSDKKWQAIDEVKGIQRRWEAIKKLPPDEAKQQDTEYQKLLDEFEKNKVEYLVTARQKEEDNHTGKLAILDKLNATVADLNDKTDNWDTLDQRIEEYSRQWKKIGPVPKEVANQLWDKFHAAKDAYFEKKYELNPAYKKELERNYKIMLSICEETEQLLNEKDLALAAHKINTLHKRWKKTGPVPKEFNDSLWERFKTATDEFNKRKEENIDVLRKQEHDNYELKKQLCDQAELLVEGDDLIKGARKMDAIMKEWKNIGPVPRNKSGKIWHRFKKTMDTFYKNRRSFFKTQREEQKKNLEEKKAIIGELKKLTEVEDANAAIELAKPIQEKFNQIGFVPIKKKDSIYKEYKDICDVIYGRARAESKGEQRHNIKSKAVNSNRSQSNKINGEIIKLKKECDKLNEEVLHFDDYITFVKPSKKGNQLRDQIQDKIDKARGKIDLNQQRIEELKTELDESEENEGT